MPRRTLEQNVAAGELTAGNVGQILGVSTPTARKLIEKHLVDNWELPLSNEMRVCPISLLNICKTLNFHFHECLETAAKNRELINAKRPDSNGSIPKVVRAVDPKRPVLPSIGEASEPESVVLEADEDTMKLPLDEFKG